MTLSDLLLLSFIVSSIVIGKVSVFEILVTELDFGKVFVSASLVTELDIGNVLISKKYIFYSGNINDSLSSLVFINFRLFNLTSNFDFQLISDTFAQLGIVALVLIKICTA